MPPSYRTVYSMIGAKFWHLSAARLYFPESMFRVSPIHHIELAAALLPMLDSPPATDYVIRRISQKSVNGQPLIQGELVISGRDTLEQFPLAAEFPLHFRKTYYPTCFHQNPAQEYENHLAASKIIAIPPPIGATRTTFRSCFLPGTPYDRLSPFGAEPVDRNLQIAQDCDPAAAIGLWKLLQDIHSQVLLLHDNGFAHGDLFLHNIIVTPTPIGAHLIDFEQAVRRTEALDAAQWKKRKQADLEEILREAACLQCALGQQEGDLADASMESLPTLMQNPERFRKTITRLTPHA